VITTRPVIAGVTFALLLAGCGGAPAPDPTPTPTAVPPGDHACSPYVRLDGFDDGLDGTEFKGTYVGNLSALAVDRDGSILALSDRSALFTLDPRTLRPTAVTELLDEQREPLDSEGLVVEPDGARLVTSEIGPSVRRYRPDGTLLGRLPVPEELTTRAVRNQSFEGLARLPDGTLVASMEGPLDGESTVRFQTWVADRPAAQFRYPPDPGFGVSDIAALADGRLLVLERTYLPNVGNGVHLYLTRLGDEPMTKTLLADIGRCPALGAKAEQPQPNPLLDNIEGMTITGRDPDGGLHLLLVSDDNQRRAQTTRLYRLTVRPPG
jgi:hypothetical protein